MQFIVVKVFIYLFIHICLSGPILESKSMGAILQKKSKEMLKKC